MKTTLIVLLMSFLSGVSIAQNPFDSAKIKQTNLKYIVLGQPGSPEECYPSIKIAPKYGYNIEYWGEPNEPWSSWDSIFKANERVDSILNIINGEGWKEKYETEVKATFQRDSILIRKVKELKFIRKRKKHDSYLFYFVDSILPNNVFRVNAVGYLKNGNGVKGSFFRIYIRQDTYQVVKIDKKIIALTKRRTED